MSDTNHTVESCTNTIRIAHIEEDVGEIKDVMREVVKTQAIIAKIEERSAGQSSILAGVVASQQDMSNRMVVLERAIERRAGGDDERTTIGRTVIGIAVVGTAIVALIALVNA